ncbi:hypothetical protein HTZ84_21375 [Haloterrigena sp. SYSU A558-1]|uniref:Uncharacterized protein n=1 Tax=Haloterrigena gelatinilytica TaxID=2741724 RepID=A0ABX2LHG4_9EURY|nr:hypothetical protein [Haloterrigena gelatinilytica]NUC74818.1 hypothetical protein [Haloterrigena gelatinilytica]
MISLLGVACNFVGSAFMAVPQIPSVFKWFHSYYPISNIDAAETKLYTDEEITKKNPNFGYMSKILRSMPEPFNQGRHQFLSETTAVFYSESFDEEIRVETAELNLIKIEKIGDDYVSDSDFRLIFEPKNKREMRSKLPVVGEDISFRTEVPNGRFPDMVEEYKETFFVKWGVIILTIGFLIQLSPYALSLII